MPWALAPELAVVGVAVLGALLCMGGAYLIRAIAAVLPDIPLIFTHLDLGALFEDATWPIVSWLTSETTALFKFAEDWLRAIPYVLEGLVSDVASALGHSFTLVDHLFNAVIPNTAAGTLAQAEAYAQNAADFVHTEAHNGIAALAATVQTDLGAALGTAEGFVDAGVGALRDYVDREINRARGYADSLVNALNYATPADLVAVGATVAALATEYETCAVKVCSGKSNQFSNLLSDALGIADVSVLGAFVAELLNSPAAAASDLVGWVSGAVSGAQSTLDELLAI